MVCAAIMRKCITSSCFYHAVLIHYLSSFKTRLVKLLLSFFEYAYRIKSISWIIKLIKKKSLKIFQAPAFGKYKVKCESESGQLWCLDFCTFGDFFFKDILWSLQYTFLLKFRRKKDRTPSVAFWIHYAAFSLQCRRKNHIK